jgi:hypothetical protein
MHKSLRTRLGYEETDSEKEILKYWKTRTRDLCKPCWELHYCPYGPLVEDFPLLPLLRKEALEHKEYLKDYLAVCRT